MFPRHPRNFRGFRRGGCKKENYVLNELLRNAFLLYLVVTVFAITWLSLFVIGVLKNSKQIESKLMRLLLCFLVLAIFLFVFSYFFIYQSLYPITLAYYEFKNDMATDVTGRISEIYQDGRDRMKITVGEQTYIMVYDKNSVYAEIAGSLSKGDTVTLRVGNKSNYVFDISK